MPAGKLTRSAATLMIVAGGLAAAVPGGPASAAEPCLARQRAAQTGANNQSCFRRHAKGTARIPSDPCIKPQSKTRIPSDPCIKPKGVTSR